MAPVSASPVLNPATNSAGGQTCGAINSSTFGTVVRNTNYSPDTISGWYKRQYNWTASAGVQHEIRAGFSVNASYYRTWFGNFTTTHNQFVAPADYDPYCVTAPTDSRLPGGGGNQICGFYDIKPTKISGAHPIVLKELGSHTSFELAVVGGSEVTMPTTLSSGPRAA